MVGINSNDSSFSKIVIIFLNFGFVRYRKVTGDTCRGGVEDQYAAEMVSCPIRGTLIDCPEISVTVIIA